MEEVSAVVVMNNKLGREGDDDYHDFDSSIDCLPPGFRFHPTDEEIITHYLCRKVLNIKFTASAVGEVDLNKCEPWDLPKKAKMGEKEWYFFCQRDRKYPTGMRTNRATDAGYWKATGKDKEIYKGKQQPQLQQGCLVGMKKTLVFYRGRAPKGEKTNWVMHEYRLEGKFSYYNLPKSAKDEWVVCRVFHKNNTGLLLIKKNHPYSSSSSSSSSILRMNSFGDEELLLMNNSPSLPPLVLDPSHHHQHHHFNSNSTTTTTTTRLPSAAAAAGSSTFMMNNNNNINIGNDQRVLVLEKDDEFKSMTKSTRFFDNGSTNLHHQLNISSSYNPTGSIMENNYYNINYLQQQQGNPSPNTVVPHPNSNSNNIFYPQNINSIVSNSHQFSFHGSSSNMGFGNNNNNIIPSSCYSYLSNTSTDQAILRALADYEPSSSSSYDHQLMVKRECKVEPLFHSNNQSMVSLSQDTCLSTDINTEISSVITKHEDSLGNNNINGSCYHEHLLDQVPAASSDDHPVVDLDSLWDY